METKSQGELRREREREQAAERRHRELVAALDRLAEAIRDGFAVDGERVTLSK